MSNQQDGSLAPVIDAKLIELEFECDSMTLEDVYKRYRSHGWIVLEPLNDNFGTFTLVNRGWSEKGVRHFLALLELEEFAFSDDGGGEERREPTLRLCEDPTAEIDPDRKH